jgi:DNA polymerase (family 10)
VRLYQESVGRRPLPAILEHAERIEAALRRVPGVERAIVAGSLRRRRETIGDIDIVVAAESSAGARASAAFERLPGVVAVEAKGPHKTLVRLDIGLDADLQVIEPASFGAALLYFTGSKAHSIALRRLAITKGYKLNEYGLFEGDERVAGRSEAGIYAALGLDWIAPELREDAGEIEAAMAGELPELVEARDIRGDLHVHSNWTDGGASIEAMAEAARAIGLEYLAITDELDEDRLRAQLIEIHRINRELEGIRVLSGVEASILADGSLALPDELLAEVEVVGVALHSQLDLPRDQMTRRLIRAIEHPHVDMLMHPSARALGRRPPIDCDFEAVLAACVRSTTILEVNAQPHRLDLPDTLVRRAIEAGARIAINSGARSSEALEFVARFGLGVARRGWAERGHVINSRSCDDLLATLAAGRARAAS